MNMTEKNGQPSMEEILASIRRIIAEEPSYPHNGELRGTPILVKGDGALDDASEFDLPAIFRASPPAAAERPAPLLGRLTEAIRSATTSQPEARGSANGEDHQPVSADSSLQALSSLKTARSEARSDLAEPVQPLNGTSLNHAAVGHVPQPAPSQAGAFPSMAAGPGQAKEEPKRVMTPFKDTHFTRMSGPAPAASPSPVAPAPVAATPAPAPAPAPAITSAPAPVATAQPYAGPSPDFTAIIPGQFDRVSLVNGQHPYAAGQPSPVPPRPYVAPVAMPPPPLPISEPIQNALVPSPSGGGEEPGTIEDTTADLLRPMLRQWLADNMPRMVEKALHIEIAESIKAPKKP
jgi:cell pole-organizing protein PopZ